MKARLITMSGETPIEPHFEHAVDHGATYGQLWLTSSLHVEFTVAGLRELAAQATELADGA